MKHPIAVLVAPILAVAAPASAQTAAGGLSNGILTPPSSIGFPNQFRTGLYDFDEAYDDVTTRIDRRNSARYQAARMARHARERAERAARRGR